MVEIRLDIVPNERASEYARNNYTLEAMTIFNQDDILSLEAPGAQVQLIGNLRAVLFLGLPGEECHYTIRVGSEDFAFGGMTFLMVPATLSQLEEIAKLSERKDDLEDNYNKLSGSIDSLLDAMTAMTGSLNASANGLEQLNKARGIFSDGKGVIYSGTDALREDLSNLADVLEPVEGQIDDLIGEINTRTARSERVLVTTLTKKMAEDLTAYLTNAGIKVRYMHHDIDTIERMEIIRDLRLGTFDVLVGINLLREGLDLPEVSLVAILDADKEGFLRSETSLIQTIGRAARNADGLVVMYADSITPSMRRAIDETERRRAKQDAFNREHGIVPKTVIKSVRDVIDLSGDKDELPHSQKALSKKERETAIAKLEKEMREASKRLEFEYAAVLRDRIIELRGHG